MDVVPGRVGRTALRRPPRVPGRTLACVLVGAAVTVLPTGCGVAPPSAAQVSTSAGPTQSGVASATAPTIAPAVTVATADELRAGGSSVAGLFVAADVGQQPQADGSVVLTFSLADGETAMLVTPVGGSFEVLDDRSLVVHDAAGTPVAGIRAPVTTGIAVRLEAAGDVLRLVSHPAASTPAGTASPAADPPSPASTTTVSLWLTSTAIVSVEWGEREGGRSLGVVPTDWARGGGQAAEQLGWADVLALAPEAGSDGMHDQFVCHALGAPDKAAWNLEPWRPDVGLLGTLAAQCNP